MTKEEALKICRLALKCFANKHSDYIDEAMVKHIAEINDIEVMLEALERQIPKAPMESHRFADLEIGFCPNCFQGINSEDSYCPHCGQKVDWKGAEE